MNNPNKAITNKEVEEGKIKTTINSFHFAGGMEYEPLTVEAGSREEAEKLWEARRVKVKV
ncbi:MAG: hypothetical protein NTX85_03285 [Candidatus Nomurabacteria bacterium]|nr:hypothetical protein [Candidatus Nomurabacteria bacterium]MCX6788446.1 hypothetical protein [Candidatus Jorgensenbacteria bacterium]